MTIITFLFSLKATGAFLIALVIGYVINLNIKSKENQIYEWSITTFFTSTFLVSTYIILSLNKLVKAEVEHTHVYQSIETTAQVILLSSIFCIIGKIIKNRN